MVDVLAKFTLIAIIHRKINSLSKQCVSGYADIFQQELLDIILQVLFGVSACFPNGNVCAGLPFPV